MTYRAPVGDIQFTLETIAGFGELYDLPAFAELSPDLLTAILEEAGKFAAEKIAPLNASFDREGCTLIGGTVRTPAGYREAYRAFVDAGWNGLAQPAEIGGQGLPAALGAAVSEIWSSANLSFYSLPSLTQGAIAAIAEHGDDRLRRMFLPALVSGEWTGTMNLTEPQAGSDVGALRSRAEPAADGHWRIRGQKIFITGGDHDLTDNIIHLVLARTPGAPAGTRGVSLFLVPKFLPNTDGTVGARNDITTVGLEHKLGMRGSPTCTLSFGDDGGCVGYLVGAEGGGMSAMFTMMNHARLTVALQGPALGERAYQQALAYAGERRQGLPIGAAPGSAIVEHPDVRRMLLTMAALTQASRAICYATGVALDIAHHHPDPAKREAARARAALLTPIAKSWATDAAVEVTSLGIQVHGGMGFIEETGAAQHYRDVRIAPIYEGTNGIQALDLVMRKVQADSGRSAFALIEEIEEAASERHPALRAAVRDLRAATEWIVAAPPVNAASAAHAYLQLFGTALGAFLLARGATAGGASFAALAHFYDTQILARTSSYRSQVIACAALDWGDPRAEFARRAA